MAEDTEAKLDAIASEGVQKELESLAAQCEAKLGIPKKQLFDAYGVALKKTNPELSDEERAQRALIVVKGPYKQQLSSPARLYEGIVLGASDKFDMFGKMRATALELFQVSPQKAIEAGLTNVDGVPLDSRQQYASSGKTNPNFGKPLAPHAYIRNLFGKYREKDSGEEHKVFKMPLGDAQHEVPVPTMKCVVWRGNIAGNQPDPSVTKMNPYAHIRFDEIAFPEGITAESFLVDADENPLVDLNRFAIPLGDLPEFHEKHASDPQRVLITVADVIWIDPEPNPSTGNILIRLEDPSLPENVESVVAWVPAHLQPLSFGMGSRCYVIGSSTQTERGEPPEKDWMINVQGLFAIPRYRMAPDEAPSGILSQQVK